MLLRHRSEPHHGGRRHAPGVIVAGSSSPRFGDGKRGHRACLSDIIATPRRSHDARVSAHRHARPGRGAKLPVPSMTLRRAGTVLVLVLAALVLFASFARSTERIRLMVGGLAAGAVVVCLVGLITRTMPDVWPIAPDLQQGRLGYPLTYW